MHVHTIEPDPTLDTPVIQQINEALLDASPYWTDSYDILMPAGEFVGYIEIPEDMFDIMIYIRGSQAGETIIHGGIHNTTGCCEVFNVHLIGARDILDSEDFIVSNLLLPIGALIFMLFCCTKYGWGFDNYIAEVNKGTGIKITPKLKWYFQIVVPILIVGILISGLIGL